MSEESSCQQGCSHLKAHLRESPLGVAVSRPACLLPPDWDLSSLPYRCFQRLPEYLHDGQPLPPEPVIQEREKTPKAFTITSAIYSWLHRLTMVECGRRLDTEGLLGGCLGGCQPQASFYNRTGNFDHFTQYRNRWFSISLALNSNLLSSNMALKCYIITSG